MMKKFIGKCIHLIMVMLMILSISPGCKNGKPGQTVASQTGNQQTSLASGGKTLTASKSAVKSATVKATTKSDTSGKDPDGSQNGEDVNGTDNQNDENTEDNGENNENEDETGNIGDNDTTIGSGAFEGCKFDGSNIDLQGKTVTLALRFPAASIYYREDAVALKIREQLKIAEQKLNCKIEFITPPTSNWNVTLINNHIAGVHMAEALDDLTQITIMMAYNKVFRPLDDYIDFTHPKYSKYAAIGKGLDNKYYGIVNQDIIPQWFWYNTDLYAQAGVEDPFEMYLDKRWDWDALLDHALRLTKDLNGDGITDQYFMTGDPRITIFGLLRSNGSSYIELDENGIFRCELVDDSALRALNFYRELKFVHKTIVDGTVAVNVPNNAWNKGTAASMFAARFVKRDFNYVPNKAVPPPMGPDLKSDLQIGDYSTSWHVFTNSPFKTEEILAVINLVYYNDPDNPNIYRDEFELFVEDPSMFCMGLTEQEQRWWYDYVKNTPFKYDYSGSFNPPVNQIMNQNISVDIRNGVLPKTVIDTYIQQINEGLNQFNK